MGDEHDRIWISEAVTEYGRSRNWLQKQVDEGKLSPVQIPGDRRLYLLRSELDRLLRPRVVGRDGEDG